MNDYTFTASCVTFSGDSRSFQNYMHGSGNTNEKHNGRSDAMAMRRARNRGAALNSET